MRLQLPTSVQLRRGCFSGSGFFYATVDPDDKWSQAALNILAQVHQQRLLLVTTNLIVAETHALLVNGKGRWIAFSWLENVEQLSLIERVSEADEAKAKAILRQYADQNSTLTDATSFAVIERLGLPIAYAGKFVVLPLSGTKLPS